MHFTVFVLSECAYQSTILFYLLVVTYIDIYVINTLVLEGGYSRFSKYQIRGYIVHIPYNAVYSIAHLQYFTILSISNLYRIENSQFSDPKIHQNITGRH